MTRFLIPGLCLLAACDASPPPEAETRQPALLFEAQRQTLDKAREVEDQLIEATTRQQRHIDDTMQ